MNTTFNNETISIEAVQDILMERAFVTFDIDDTAIALSIVDSLNEMTELFIYQYDDEDALLISTEQYEMIINDFFILASELVNKY